MTTPSQSTAATDEHHTKQTASTPPPYGLQSYWEQRYEKCLLPDAKTGGSTRNVSDDTLSSSLQAEHNLVSHDNPRPGFAWYFTYEELKPLIVPLVQELFSVSVDGGGTTKTREGNDRKGKRNGCLPKILEIGCGDVPLGPSLALDLELADEEDYGKILCTDYSKTVISYLKDKQKTKIDCRDAALEHTNGSKETDTSTSPDKRKRQKLDKPIAGDKLLGSRVHVEYEAADAMSLPYLDEQFVLVIDKGMVDAVVSDPKEGENNVRRIVKEVARVLAFNGALMIVSHLNANDEEGECWLHDVIIAGLESANAGASWEIEIHSSGSDEEEDPSADEGGENELGRHMVEEETEEGSCGPAVYIIRKKKSENQASSKAIKKREHDGDDDDEEIDFSSNVVLKFVSY